MPFWTKNGGRVLGFQRESRQFTGKWERTEVVNKFSLGHPETVAHSRGMFRTGFAGLLPVCHSLHCNATVILSSFKRFFRLNSFKQVRVLPCILFLNNQPKISIPKGIVGVAKLQYPLTRKCSGYWWYPVSKSKNKLYPRRAYRLVKETTLMKSHQKYIDI